MDQPRSTRSRSPAAGSRVKAGGAGKPRAGRAKPSPAARYYTPETLPVPSEGAKAILDAIDSPSLAADMAENATDSSKSAQPSSGDLRSIKPTDKGLRGVAFGPGSG
jgi:hypothetical protein